MHTERRLALRRELRELARIGPWLEAAARDEAWPETLTFAVQLCIEEAVSNVIRHGGDAAGTEIAVSIGTDQGALRLMIEDEGKAFDPTRFPDPAAPASLEEAKIGGQGIHLMRRFAQKMAYDRSDGHNRLRLWFANI